MEDLRIWIDSGSEKMVRIAGIQLSYHLLSMLCIQPCSIKETIDRNEWKLSMLY